MLISIRKGIKLLTWIPVLFPLVAFAHINLHSFIAQSLATHPLLSGNNAALQVAQSQAQSASQPLYNPELEFQQQNGIDKQISIGFNQTIDWTDKRALHTQVGVDAVKVAEAKQKAIQQQFIVNLLTALVKYRTYEKELTLSQKRSQLLHDFTVFAKKRFKSGDISKVDLDLAQLAYSEAKSQEATIMISYSEALSKLRTLNSPGFDYPELPSHLPSLTMSSLTNTYLIQHQPIVKMAQREYVKALETVRMVNRDRYPDPTIGIQVGRNTGQEENKRLVGLTVTIPLPIRNTYQADVAAAQHEAEEADANYAATLLQAKAEAQSQLERYQSLYRTVQQWDQLSSKPLANGMALIHKLWQSGDIDTANYLIQFKQRLDSQIAGVELRGQAWIAWIDCLNASGQVDSWLKQEA